MRKNKYQNGSVYDNILGDAIVSLTIEEQENLIEELTDNLKEMQREEYKIRYLSSDNLNILGEGSINDSNVAEKLKHYMDLEIKNYKAILSKINELVDEVNMLKDEEEVNNGQN